MARGAPWARTEHRESTRIGVTLLVAPVFLGLLPWLVARAGPRLDRALGMPVLPIPPAGRIAARVVTVAGFSLGLWSVSTQLDRGRGTPLPVMPTQVLLTSGPFRYGRNPMTLGATLAYLGIGVSARTPAGIALVLGFAASLLVYLTRLEEHELVARFGEPYVVYRRATPFIVPRFPGRSTAPAAPSPCDSDRM